MPERLKALSRLASRSARTQRGLRRLAGQAASEARFRKYASQIALRLSARLELSAIVWYKAQKGRLLI